MPKLLLPLAVAAAILGDVTAYAASLNLTVTVNDPASTSVSCSPGTLTAPIAAGTTICAITVAPSAWLSPPGTFTLSGTNAADFAISSSNLVVAPSVTLSAGSYAVTITATP